MLEDIQNMLNEMERGLEGIKPFDTFAREEALKNSEDPRDKQKNIHPAKFGEKPPTTVYDAVHSVGKSSSEAVRFGIGHDIWKDTEKKSVEEKYDEYLAFEIKRIVNDNNGI